LYSDIHIELLFLPDMYRHEGIKNPNKNRTERAKFEIIFQIVCGGEMGAFLADVWVSAGD